MTEPKRCPTCRSDNKAEKWLVDDVEEVMADVICRDLWHTAPAEGAEPEKCSTCNSPRKAYRRWLVTEAVNRSNRRDNLERKFYECPDPWHEAPTPAEGAEPHFIYSDCPCEHCQTWLSETLTLREQLTQLTRDRDFWRSLQNETVREKGEAITRCLRAEKENERLREALREIAQMPLGDHRAKRRAEQALAGKKSSSHLQP